MFEHNMKNAYLWEYGKLPSEYQKVEYIQSTGSQYIDTWYIIKPSTTVETDFQFTSTSNQLMAFWIGTDTDTSNWVTFCVYIWSGSYWACWMRNWKWTNTWNTSSVVVNTNRNKIVLSNWKFEVYNSWWTKVVDMTTTSTISATANHSMWIFCWREMYYSQFRNLSPAKLYSFIIKEWKDIVHYYIPCYRKSDSVIWLYDIENDNFLTNAGSWTFTKWPDVN